MKENKRNMSLERFKKYKTLISFKKSVHLWKTKKLVKEKKFNKAKLKATSEKEQPETSCRNVNCQYRK